MSTFKEAIERARNITCADREGSVTCYTVEPFIDDLEKAHLDEVTTLRAFYDRVRAIVSSVGAGVLRTPWRTDGRRIYDGTYEGAPVAAFRWADAEQACRQTVAVVNMFDEIRKALEEVERHAAE